VQRKPEVPYKFHCRVRVTSYAPDIEQLTRPYCTDCQSSIAPLNDASEVGVCPHCHKQLTTYVYMFALDVEDASDKLNAILFKDDAVQFFYGLPPDNLFVNRTAYQTIARKLSKLTEKDVWLDCCIKSYRSKKGEKKFRIFDTTLSLA